MGWTLVILAETLRPVPPIPPLAGAEASHFLGFLFLGFLAIMAMRCWRVSDGPWIAALGCLIFGTIDEGGQLWVPGRAVEMQDLAANVGGAFVGIALTAAVLAWLNLWGKTGV